MTVQAVEKLVNRFCSGAGVDPDLRKIDARAGQRELICLTSVLDVADDAVINGFAFVVELSIIMPVHVAVV